MALGNGQAAASDSIAGLCNTVLMLVMGIPPKVDRAALRAVVAKLADRDNWDERDDSATADILRETSKKLDRRNAVKAGGIAAFGGYPEIQRALSEIVGLCKHMGLFLVPVGELEYWIPDLGVSKSKKSEWANAAATRIGDDAQAASTVIEFVKAIAKRLEDERNRIALLTA